MSRRSALLAPALAAAAFQRAAVALSLPPPDPWAFSPDVKSIQISPYMALVDDQGTWWLRTGPEDSLVGRNLKPGGLLRPELGDELGQRAAEVPVTALRRRPYYRIRLPSEPVAPGPAPLPRVLFPDSRTTTAASDLRSVLYITVNMHIRDLTDKLPERPRAGQRFIMVQDHFKQDRYPESGNITRASGGPPTFHTVTPDTIEGQVLRRFDESVERAVLFSGPGYD